MYSVGSLCVCVSLSCVCLGVFVVTRLGAWLACVVLCHGINILLVRFGGIF